MPQGKKNLRSPTVSVQHSLVFGGVDYGYGCSQRDQRHEAECEATCTEELHDYV